MKKLLDLFCGAGGCAMGYWRAGYHDITGIDNRPQKNYPFDFHQADVFDWCSEHDLSRYDLIHASPPCQAHSSLKHMYNAIKHPNLIPATRKLLTESGCVTVVENVMGAPLIDPIMLCGTMFGLGTNDSQLWRHRIFEINKTMPLTPHCQHHLKNRVIGVYGGHGRDRRRRTCPQQFTVEERRVAMGILWMTGPQLSQAIPPAYTEWIGNQTKK